MGYLRTTLAALTFGAAALAQTQSLQGFLFNWDRPNLADGVDLVTRYGTGAESDLNRIDYDDYRDWGANANGQIQVQGFLTWMYDSNYTTAESYSFVGYNGNATNNNFPQTTAVVNITNIPMPAGTNGNIYRVGGTFNAAVNFANTADVFVGIGLPAMVSPTAPYDGLWIGTASRYNAAAGTTTWDEPGPMGQVTGGSIGQGSYVCYIVNNQTIYLQPSATSLQQLALDVFIAGGGVGGVALTRTNQTVCPTSNAPYGTSNFISGLHPDINGLNSGRQDDFGFGLEHNVAQLPLGSPVFILLAFGPSPLGSSPITNFQPAQNPDSGGRVCIDFTTAATFFTTTVAGRIAGQGEAQLIVPLNAQVRAVIAAQASPFNVWWQGFALDTTNTGPNFEVRATGCAIQHLK